MRLIFFSRQEKQEVGNITESRVAVLLGAGASSAK